MTIQTRHDYAPAWTIGDRLRRIRRDAGLTQAQFAELLQVGDKRYAAWESEANTPGGNALMGMAARVQVLFGRAAREFLLGLEMPTAPGPDNGPEGGDLLPRLDSNQQPSGYRFALVSGLERVA